MFSSLKFSTREPQWIIATLWPLALLVPYLPGVPRPALGGLSWRQEMVLGGLLTVTLTLLFKRARGRTEFVGTLGASPIALMLTATTFTLWVAASTFWAANPYSAGHYTFTWGAYILFFVLMRMVAARPRLLRASFYALGSVVWLLSISCLIESLAGGALTDHELRLTAKPLFRGFSGFSEVMAVATPIFAALALDIRKWQRAMLCGVTALLAWSATLQALERAPILGGMLGLMLLTAGAILVRQCRPQRLMRTAVFAAAMVVVTAVHFVPFWSASRNPIPDASVLQRFQTTSITEPNTSVRLLFWGIGWEMFRAHPLLGVGANNYEVAYPLARAQFSAINRNSPLIGMNEHLLTQYAHNEYVEILAELGVVGLLLFLAFCLALTIVLKRALRNARRPLLVLGSGAGLFAFALSSGASAFSFRWLGSGLIFFFAAALVSHFAAGTQRRAPTMAHTSMFARTVTVCALVVAIVTFLGASAQATNSVMHAWAQSTRLPERAEQYYQLALRFNSFDPATHYDYGSFLYQRKRPAEAISHLRYAVEHGINTSISYAYLAAAEEEAGDSGAAEQTLAFATRVYPRSVFLLVRHAAALERIGKTEESKMEFSAALLLDSRGARGWYQLINFDIDAALAAAKQDTGIAAPGELLPQNGVYVVLQENERRLHISPTSGWRGRVHSIDN